MCGFIGTLGEASNDEDMLKKMTVQEQTLYKKWQEMNKGKKCFLMKALFLIMEC